MKLEENESVNNTISRIKDFNDKLCDIGENVSSTTLVAITLSGMLEKY